MEVHETYGDQVRIVGVPALADIGDFEQFIARNDVGALTHIPDVQRTLWERFGVVRHRAYVLIDDDGTWRSTPYGSLEEDVRNLIAS